jgi:hypothetical protein
MKFSGTNKIFFMLKSISASALCVVLVSCASPKEVLENGTITTFNSTKSSQSLTTCIDRNIDGAVLNSLKTNIKVLGPESSEIVVRNNSLVFAVVQVNAATHGSVASIRLGGLGAMTPETSMKRLTAGCE